MTPSSPDNTQVTLPAEKNYLLKRKNFIYLFIVVVLAFGSKDYIINSLINIDEDHKEIVRVLAEQNMLSQRITKLGLLIQNDFEKDTIANSRPDSLAKLIPRWVGNHQWLLKHNIKHGEDDIIAEIVTSQIIEATKYVEIISKAGMEVLKYRKSDRVKLDKAVWQIDYHELPYHALVEKSLNMYKAQMLEEHRFLTKLQYALSVIAILVLVGGFVVLIIPIFNKLTKEISLRKQVELNLTKAVQNYLVSETVLSRNKKELEEVNEAISRSALVTITDADGIILKANQLFCEVTGYTEEELIGRNHKLISSNHHTREFWREFWLTIKSGNSWKGEVKNKSKDGRDIWLETVINPIMGENGTIRQFLAIRFDITEKKRAERKAARLDNELRTISNTFLPIAIISTDKDGNIVLFSKGAEALLGFTPAEMVGKTPMEFHDHNEVMARNAELVLELKRPISGFETFTVTPEANGFESRQWTYIKKDGTRFPVELVVSPMKNEAGLTTGYVGIATDISERVMAEKAMVYAKEQAEDANRSKSQFLANMSHEIRTPLNSILGFSELLSESIHEPKQQRQLNTIISSGRTLLSLINDLLNIAKIESGKVELELHETNLHKMAREVSHMFMPEAKPKNVHLSVETTPGFPETVLADDTRIRQILVNLTGN
ncbi:MAG: PAS domain S-box protein, partial [Bacteroidota bacterium]